MTPAGKELGVNIPDRFSLLQSWEPSLCPHRWPAGPAAGGAGWQWVRKGRLQAQVTASPGRCGWTLHLLCFSDGRCKGDTGRDLVLCVPPGACTPLAVAGSHAKCQQLLGR